MLAEPIAEPVAGPIAEGLSESTESEEPEPTGIGAMVIGSTFIVG